MYMSSIKTQEFNILLVEDNLADAKLFKKALSGSSDIEYKIINARSLTQAFTFLSKHNFDIIVLDLFLPDEQGLDTFKSIYLNCKHIPIIILSGLTSENIALEAIKLGAQDYLIKGPHFFAILERSIKYAIYRKKQEQEIKDLNLSLETRVLELAQINYELESTHKKLHETKDENLFSYQAKLQLTSEMLSLIQATSKSCCEAIKLLGNTSLKPEQVELLNIIEQSCKNTYDKTLKSMYFHNLKETILFAQNDPFNLENVVNSTVELFIPFLKEKNIFYSVYFDPNLPDTFTGDEYKIRQILISLMSNIIKSAVNGYILIRADLDSILKNNVCSVSLMINSSNNEIDSEFLHLLLENKDNFTPIEMNDEHNLSIALCKSYIDLLSGSLEIVKNDKLELIVKCKMPLQAIEIRTGLKIFNDNSNIKILVICDNIVESKHLAEYLGHLSLSAEFYHNIDEGLEKLIIARQNNSNYNLCIIDLESELKNNQLINRIVHNPGFKNLKLIIIGNSQLQGYDTFDQIIAFLNKPFLKDELFLAVNSLKPSRQIMPVNQGKLTPNISVKPRILLAEDNLTLQKLFVNQIEKLNFAIDVVSNGKQAVNLFIENEYSMVILDYQMPVMNGSKASEIMRNIEKFQEYKWPCPIIMMSSCATEEQIKSGIVSGANEFIFKPVGLTELSNILNRYVYDYQDDALKYKVKAVPKAKTNTINGDKVMQNEECDLSKISAAKIIECIETKCLEAKALAVSALHEDALIRSALAVSKFTPAYILYFLSLDDDVNVRYSVAENHLTPLDILTGLAEDENAYVAYRASKTLKNLKS